MPDRKSNEPRVGPQGDHRNWRDTNGVETPDSQADGTDVADEGGSASDRAAPDQRTPDDRERNPENRGSNTP